MSDVKIVCLSDIHNNKIPSDEMPEGDILIIAGDATNRGTHTEFHAFRESLLEWESKFKYIVYVPGKHDIGMEDSYQKYHDFLTEVPNLVILVNTDTVLLGLRIWGSPTSKEDKNWAFTVKERERDMVFREVPNDTDILVTYSPAEGILDEVEHRRNIMIGMGCCYIRKTLERVKPRLHVCGSSHESYGAAQDANTLYINASLVDGEFKPLNKPAVITLTNV